MRKSTYFGISLALVGMGLVLGIQQASAQPSGPLPFLLVDNLDMTNINTMPGALPGFNNGSYSVNSAYSTNTFSQACPALPVNRAQSAGTPVTSFGSCGPRGLLGQFATPPPTASANYSLASARPNFTFNKGSLNFTPSASGPTTGQTSMGIGPGRPAGSVRFVPVGQF